MGGAGGTASGATELAGGGGDDGVAVIVTLLDRNAVANVICSYTETCLLTR